VPPLVRVRESGPGDGRAAETKVVESLGNRAQTGFDVTQALAIGELREEHRQELVPASEAANPVVAAVPPHQAPEGMTRQVIEKLREDRASLVHEQSPGLEFNPGSHAEGPRSSR